jgi:hypothetical protein
MFHAYRASDEKAPHEADQVVSDERPGRIEPDQPTSALDFEIVCGRLAFIRDFLVFNNLTLIQTGQTSPFDGRNMYKDVVPASALRLNEPVSFLRIEPLHRAACH